MASLRVATWNINGLSPNINELEALIASNNLDVVLISESHATSRSSYRLKGFQIYCTPHPDGGAHAGSALVIRSSLKHCLLEAYSTNHLQATSVRLEDRAGPVTLSAIYCPPKHIITNSMFSDYFKTLGNRFISGGDWNAKHTFWGSRLSVTRGRQLKICIDRHRYRPLSTGEPTYWPTDPKKKPDLLDFFVTKGLSPFFTKVESSLDGSSDHTPAILTLSLTVASREGPILLHNKKTDWEGFRSYLTDHINLRTPLKTADDIEEACKYITNMIQTAAWRNTPSLPIASDPMFQPAEIKNKIAEKRRLRRIWHRSRHPSDKSMLNKAIKDLKLCLEEHKNNILRLNLESMSPSARGEHSLWKATKHVHGPQQSNHPIRCQSSWARTDKDKAEAFAMYLAKVFQPNESNNQETDVDSILNQDIQLCLPIKPTSPREIAREVKLLNPKKAPGFDLITPRILKELPRKCITFLACLFNATYRVGYFPNLWKVSEIVMIHKDGKPPHESSSYRPISLTPVLSKLWERIFLKRLSEVINEHEVIPGHQFGFRKAHSTTEQVHRVYHTIRQCFENKKYCSAAFLDVQQAFDRVWHKGLLSKIKEKLPHSVFHILKSYLSNRLFQVKQGDARSSLFPINAGVPQGSVLGPILYNIYTSDLPTLDDVTVATYADDIAFLAVDDDPTTASEKLQRLLDATTAWFQKWRIKASSHKSNHITFTLRKENCAPVHLMGSVLPQTDCVKYLGFHLDRRLTWKHHIKIKRDQVNLKFRNLYWLMGRNSVLSLDNKLLIYNSILKPIWTYGIQLWGVASKSNVMCLQRVQNNILKNIVNAPWFARNDEIHEYLNIATVASEIERYKKHHVERLTHHPNPLASGLLDDANVVKRIKRNHVL